MNHTHRVRRRRTALVSAGIATALLLAACTSGSDDSADTTPDATTADTTAAAETTVEDTTVGTEATDAPDTTDAAEVDTVDQTLTGDAPGVTDDTVKIGITYVDTASLVASGLNYDLGPYEDVFNALVADINANGGVNGRQLEAVYAPIDPTNAAGAEAACLKLTEDDDVFLITGFFLGESTMCPLETHSTAVVGGDVNPALAARALAPWATWQPDADQVATVTRLFAERGEFDGKKVAVYYTQAGSADYENNVKPALDDLGITPVAVGVNDAPTDDPVASQNSVKLIAERFKAAGADTVLLVGADVPQWPTNMTGDPYDPQLLFTNVIGARAFATNENTSDTTILDGSLSGGPYGPDQARYDESTMQECIAIASAAGVEIPAPDELLADDPSNQPYQSIFLACPAIWLTRALLARAGANLNYGTLGAAIDGLKITIPGDPTERTYGPSPAADGDPSAYLFAWDDANKTFVLDEG